MKNETSSMASSCFMGFAVMLFGIFTEPLLAVLGGIIIVTGSAAAAIERRRRRYMALEHDKETLSKSRVA